MNDINYEIDNCITDLDTLKVLDKRAMKDLENNTHEIGQHEVLTIIREFIRLINDYNKEKEKNKKLQKRNDRQVKIINKRDKQIDEMREIANKDWEERCRLTFELNNYISKEKKAYIDGINIAHNLCNKKWEEKIKAKIEEVKDGTFDAKIVLQLLLEKE